MTWFSVDVEADGPCPGVYNMISFGAVIVEPGLSRRFYGRCRPVTPNWVPKALAVSGHTREECMSFPRPEEEIPRFCKWVLGNVGRGRSERPIFASDNNGFDWMFYCYYCHMYFDGDNPFGWSSVNINSLYKGLCKDTSRRFHHLRKTKHSHHPVDDALGNAEALLAMQDDLGLKIHC